MSTVRSSRSAPRTGTRSTKLRARPTRPAATRSSPGSIRRSAAFAWVDDEIGDADRRWVSAHHPGPALLHRVDPVSGLGNGDFAVLEAWLRTHGA